MTRRSPSLPEPRSAAPFGRAQRRDSRRMPGRPLRIVALGRFALLVGTLAITLVVSRLQPPAATDLAAQQVRASMAGFDPSALTVKAGPAVKIELSSTDTSTHSDGGGWHQLAIDARGINWKVGPESSTVFDPAVVAPLTT